MDSTYSWSMIIGLDLLKAAFKSCILSDEGFVQRKNFSGEMSARGNLKRQLRGKQVFTTEVQTKTLQLTPTIKDFQQ